jgi:hypothetical protein
MIKNAEEELQLGNHQGHTRPNKKKLVKTFKCKDPEEEILHSVTYTTPKEKLQKVALHLQRGHKPIVSEDLLRQGRDEVKRRSR